MDVDSDFKRTINDCVPTLRLTATYIKRESKTDPQIQQVYRFVQGSWPRNLTGNRQQFKRRSDSLSIIEEFLMFLDIVVMPHESGFMAITFWIPRHFTHEGHDTQFSLLVKL